ncbi:hypothetical protein MCEGKSE7_00312 [Candidatus Nanopelagicaceae bacterium]
MAKEGARSKEVTSGVLYPNGSSEMPRDILTWHLSGNYRVWVHARLIEGSGYRPISVEIEWLGDTQQSLEMPEIELRLRMELASSKKDLGINPDFQSSLLREIPMGKVIEEHANIITSQKMKTWDKSHRPVNLVSAFSTSVFTGKELEEMGSSNKKPSSLRASNTDSIVIAKVYAEQSESGHKRPAKKVAELLNLDASMVYVAVRIARKNGWLTSAGSGSSGGLLTPNGISMFESVKGNEILYSLLRKDNS